CCCNKIFYQTYGYGPTKLLLIIGLAGTHESWGPQVKGLTGTETPNDTESTTIDTNLNTPDDNIDVDNNGGIEICSFDNRGMGQSSALTKKSQYTMTIMAKDAIALMDHLGWVKPHIFRHSMGAMIACKLAAMAPNRILSLALLNVTGGGFECFPKVLGKKNVVILVDEQHKIFDPLNPFCLRGSPDQFPSKKN
ncbi:hypothetical protein GIB67_041571, partial [Kingdonia uniflora]